MTQRKCWQKFIFDNKMTKSSAIKTTKSRFRFYLSIRKCFRKKKQNQFKCIFFQSISKLFQIRALKTNTILLVACANEMCVLLDKITHFQCLVKSINFREEYLRNSTITFIQQLFPFIIVIYQLKLTNLNDSRKYPMWMQKFSMKF